MCNATDSGPDLGARISSVSIATITHTWKVIASIARAHRIEKHRSLTWDCVLRLSMVYISPFTVLWVRMVPLTKLSYSLSSLPSHKASTIYSESHRNIFSNKYMDIRGAIRHAWNPPPNKRIFPLFLG